MGEKNGHIDVIGLSGYILFEEHFFYEFFGVDFDLFENTLIIFSFDSKIDHLSFIFGTDEFRFHGFSFQHYINLLLFITIVGYDDTWTITLLF